ncbi:MAG: hypothetical protein Q8K42_02510, partial [Methylobacter sp.]|nr:hypothetical protein [Methylobacter sp.]
NKPVRALSAGLVFPALRCRKHPPWLTPGGLIPAYILRCSTSCIHAVVAYRLAKLELRPLGSQAGA